MPHRFIMRGVMHAVPAKLPARIDDLAEATDDIDGWMTHEYPRDARQGIRAEQVVRVQPAEDLAGGAGKALIDRICLALVPFAHPEGEPWRILLDDCHATVRGAAVDDDVLEV